MWDPLTYFIPLFLLNNHYNTTQTVNNGGISLVAQLQASEMLCDTEWAFVTIDEWWVLRKKKKKRRMSLVIKFAEKVSFYQKKCPSILPQVFSLFCETDKLTVTTILARTTRVARLPYF